MVRRSAHAFIHDHCVTGMAGRQPRHGADGRGPGDVDADQRAAELRMSGEQHRFHLRRHGIGHETSAGRERCNRRLHHAGLAAAAADEDHVRPRQARRSASGACPSTTTSPGTPKRTRVAADPRSPFGRRLDGDGAHRRIGKHPFDRDRARAGADVPEEFALARRECREGQRPHLPLGDLAVVLEKPLVQAVRKRQNACIGIGHHLKRADVQRVDFLHREAGSEVAGDHARLRRRAPREP